MVKCVGNDRVWLLVSSGSDMRDPDGTKLRQWPVSPLLDLFDMFSYSYSQLGPNLLDINSNPVPTCCRAGYKDWMTLFITETMVGCHFLLTRDQQQAHTASSVMGLIWNCSHSFAWSFSSSSVCLAFFSLVCINSLFWVTSATYFDVLCLVASQIATTWKWKAVIVFFTLLTNNPILLNISLSSVGIDG